MRLLKSSSCTALIFLFVASIFLTTYFAWTTKHCSASPTKYDSYADGVEILGRLDPTSPGSDALPARYAVYSTTANNPAGLGLLFLLPLTAMAWKRVGFGSVILVVGRWERYLADPLVALVFSTLRSMNGVVLVLVESDPDTSVMLSKAGYIFAGDLLHNSPKIRSENPHLDDVYLLTSDANLWPIAAEIYRLPSKYHILCLNSECCDEFQRGGVTYKMLPMSNIGATIRTWRSLTRDVIERRDGSTFIDDVIEYVSRRFGARTVQKGTGDDWSIDEEMMISTLVCNWSRSYNVPATKTSAKNSSGRIKYVPWNTPSHIVDRTSWSVPVDLRGKVNTRVILDWPALGGWGLLLPMVEALFGGPGSNQTQWCVSYAMRFQQLYQEKHGV